MPSLQRLLARRGLRAYSHANYCESSGRRERQEWLLPLSEILERAVAKTATLHLVQKRQQLRIQHRRELRLIPKRILSATLPAGSAGCITALWVPPARR